MIKFLLIITFGLSSNLNSADWIFSKQENCEIEKTYVLVELNSYINNLNNSAMSECEKNEELRKTMQQLAQRLCSQPKK